MLASAAVAMALTAGLVRTREPAPAPAAHADRAPAAAPATTPVRRRVRVSRRDADRTRVSDPGDWARFRHEKPMAAMALELAAAEALARGGLRAARADCVGRGVRLELSGEAIADRDQVTVDGWDCEATEGDPTVAARACECMLERLPSIVDVELDAIGGLPRLPVEYAGEITLGI